jgi:hypothetical protein
MLRRTNGRRGARGTVQLASDARLDEVRGTLFVQMQRLRSG